MFEVSIDSSKLLTQAFSGLSWEIFYSHVDRSLWQLASNNLKHFLEFGACFQLCFKLAVSLQHCATHVIVLWVYIRQIRRPLVLCDETWRVMGFLQDPANVQQTSSKCIQNTRANAGRLLDRVNTPLARNQFRALRAVCVLKRHPAGKWIRWAAGVVL